MRICSKCNQEKEESLMTNRKICKDCNIFNVKSHYANNPKYKESIKNNASDLRFRWRKQINDYKEIYGCLFCKESDGCCLQFHHINPFEKEFQIEGGSKRNIEKFRKEINKCEILCANCHIKLHRGKLEINERRNLNTSLLIHPSPHSSRGRPKK